MSNRFRKFVFTWNNYPAQDAVDSCFDQIPFRYLGFGKEQAPSTGTPHLQGFLYFDNGRSVESIRRLLPGVDVRVGRGSIDQIIAYCSKDGDYTELGVRPLDDAAKGSGERARWTTALENARVGDFENIDPQIFVSHYGSIRRIHAETRPFPSANDRLINFWCWGDTGVGKSRGVRERYPDIYPKPLNKWWDCYNGQREYLLDDVDPGHGPWLGGLLKQWTDHYPFIAEIKGRSEPIRPTVCCVTSQFEIEEVFTDNRNLEALTRRFKSIHLPAELAAFVE